MGSEMCIRDRTVTDNDTRMLVLQIGVASIAENAGAGAALGYVTRNANTNEPLVISLRTDDPRLSVAGSVTMAAGERAAVFNLDAVDNDLLDGTRWVNVFASAINRRRTPMRTEGRARFET